MAESRENDRLRYRLDPKRRESVRQAAQTHYREHEVELRAVARERQERKRGARIDSPAASDQANGTYAARSASQQARQSSREWQREHPGRMRRYAEKHAGRELPPGDDYTAEDVRRKLEEQGRRCAYCRRPFGATDDLRPVVDHMTPISRGGRNDAGNIVVVHSACNQAKHRQRLATFLARFDRPGFSADTRPTCWITDSVCSLSGSVHYPAGAPAIGID